MSRLQFDEQVLQLIATRRNLPMDSADSRGKISIESLHPPGQLDLGLP